jgi:hypothetical protein
MRAAFWRGQKHSHNLNAGAKGLTTRPVQRGIWSRLVGLTLVVMLLALALASILRPLRAPTARAQESAPAASSDASDPCLANLPIPSVAPGLNRVVQMVNCSNQTILGTANAAGVAPGPVVSVFPREGTWVMGAVGSLRPDGTPANVLTIDIPLAWESTFKIKSTGPLFWPRTGCRYDIPSGRAQCETGGCSGLYDCSANKLGPSVGATITEWTFNKQNPDIPNFFQDFPDISAVNGTNINVDIEPLGGSPSNPFAPNDPNWLAEQFPLTVHGQDLRSNCQPATFQVKRSDLTSQQTGVNASVIVGNDGKPIGGDAVVGCLSNCGRYEYPLVPPGLKGADGNIHAELCDPTDKTSQCYRWKVFCLPLGGAYDQPCTPSQTPGVADCNVTPPVPTAGEVVPIPPYAKGAFLGACWVRQLPGGTVPAPFCSGDSFLVNPNGCPPNICTHPFSLEPAAQPPFGSCASAVGNDASACIGDDTIHSVMNKVYTWPNDPQTYDEPAYRIIFSPGGNPSTAPITPSTSPMPLCSSLPTNYGFALMYGGPNSNTKPCDNPVNQMHAEFAVARPNSTVAHPWACDLSPGNPNANPPILPGSGDDGVLCRWFAASPTPTPTPTGSTTPTATPSGVPTQTPTATPTAAKSTVFDGGFVEIKTTRGETASTTFTATNFTGSTESISTVTIELSKPKLFSALQLSAGTQEGSGNPADPAEGTQAGTGNPSPPGPSNTFTFSPPLSLPSTGTLTFTVMGTVAQKKAMVSPSILSGGVAYAEIGLSGGSSSRSTRAPWTGLIMIVCVVTLTSAVRSRRWVLAGGALILLGTVAGCGGGSGGGSTSSAPNSIIKVTQATTVGPHSGLPLKIAKVSIK